MKKTFFALAGLCALPAMLAAEDKINKVLVIGIDGVRADALLSAKTPNIDSLWQSPSGAYSFSAKGDNITISGPSWGSILTGAGSAKTGVSNNNMTGDKFTGYNPNYPHFLSRIEAAKPNLYTAAISQWAPTNSYLSAAYPSDMVTTGNGQSVKNQAVSLLAAGNPDAIFLHFDDVDGAGHNTGYNPGNINYINAIQQVDSYIGEVLGALHSRETYDQENWLIMVTSDHGGVGTAHGGTDVVQQYVFFIANGADVKPGELDYGVLSADVAVTAMVHMGLTIGSDWNLDGKARALKESPELQGLTESFSSMALAGDITPVPEPSTYALIGGILAAGVALAARRRRKA